MDKQFNVSDNRKKCWISITGYRILLILKSLMEKDCTINEIVDIVRKNSLTQKNISKDTIRVDLNTLKSVGCEIGRPSKANAYKYHLIKHPFTFNLTNEDLDIFISLRDKLSLDLKVEDVFVLNNLYEKIISLTCNEEQIFKIKETAPLLGVDKDIYKQIINPKIIGKKIQIKYLSPSFGEEVIDVIPEKISYENGKIYLWCYIFKYEKSSLLNVERIKSIISVSIGENFDNIFAYEVIYEIFGNSIFGFAKEDNEEIIDKTEFSIRVKATVKNEFLFIQRILLFGTDFKIISPDFFKEKLIDKIKLIQKGYEE